MAREQHGMQPTELDDFKVGRRRLGQLHRGVGFQTQHVGGSHGATQIDQ